MLTRPSGRVAAIAGAAVAGPAAAAAVTAALRAVLPETGFVLSVPGVLIELAYSPVFYLSLAFALSWSLLGLVIRARPVRVRPDRWSAMPLLIWALLGNRHQEFLFSSSGFHDFPLPVRREVLWAEILVLLLSLLVTVTAMLPTLLQNRAGRRAAVLEARSLLPVAVVLADWALFAFVLTTFWVQASS